MMGWILSTYLRFIKDCREDLSLPILSHVLNLTKDCQGKLAEGLERNLVGLKGHRSVGGMRASIYNAMPLEGVKKLASFLAEFKQKNQ